MSLLDNQTRLAPGQFLSQLGSSGTATSTFTTLFSESAQFSTLVVSTINGGGISTTTVTIPPGGQINLDQANLNLLYEDATENASAIFFQWPGTLEAVPYASIQYYDEQTSTIRFQSFDYVKGTPTDDPATEVFSQKFSCSTINVSSINGAEFTAPPKMNWGAVNIPASGSTIASVADNPYSGAYYQQLTYRGNIQGSISTLFASSINGESFYIYGEPGQQVQYFTIGN